MQTNMELELEDDILSQIASALENEYVELQSLDDSLENIILSQALDSDYTVSQTVDTYGLDVSFDLGFINADGATDKQSILLPDHANMQVRSTSHETVLEYSKLVLFFLLFCLQNNEMLCLSGLCLVSDEIVQTSTINDVDHKTIRFSSPVTDVDIKKLNDTKKNKNTIKNTKWAFGIFESWRESRKEDIPELHTMDKSTMAYWLTRFVMEIRNQKGEEYAGKTLYSVLCALLRHIRDRGVHNINFLDEKDPAFSEFYKTDDSKMKDLLEKGVGVNTRQADPITEKDEDKLWDSGVFGMKDAQSLQHTVFFYNCKLFGLRGRDEHRNMNCDQFEVGEDSNGRYIRFIGRNSKTYQGGIGQMSLTNKDIKHYCSKARQNESVDASANGGSSSGGAMPVYKGRRSASRLTFAAEKINGVHKALSLLEEDFIYAAEFGDIPTVQRILEENQHLNVDFSDILGRTPLRLAVGNEHLEVVELLLDRSNLANIYEALLQAISAGHEQIAESILKHPKYQGMKKEHKHFGETDHFFNTASEDSPFSSDITPLILAAERNQFEIVQLLLLRGDMIKKPHHYYCHCQECSNKLEFDQLRLAKTRLNAYKGLCSGAYISLSSKDPILTAFELARELKGVAKVEKYFKTEYLELADQLSLYVVKLLDKVRGHDELELLINKSGRDSEQETYERLARLKLAIQYNEKKFVAHPSCQQKLVSIWYADLRALERSNWFFRSLLVSVVTSFYPVMCILYLLAPRSQVGRFLRYPCIKFIGHTMSFVAFLMMLLASSMMENPSAQSNISQFSFYTNYTAFVANANVTLPGGQSLPPDFRLRSYQPQVINLLLSLWIVGMLWQELKQVYGDGIYNYFEALYNYLDFAVLTLYITSFTLRFLTLIKVSQSIEYFKNQSSWLALASANITAQEKFYWLIADRLFWDCWDPHNIAEGLFAVANVISFTRLSYVLPANELFGPMQISLAKMITQTVEILMRRLVTSRLIWICTVCKRSLYRGVALIQDILKFGAVFAVVFCAFMVGLHNLYWYYPKEVRRAVELVPNNVTTEAEEHFGITHITFRTVFWSLFGRGEPTVVELKPYGHYFTETVGYWIFGVYNISTVIVLLNMLIAMMSRSFELIQGEADTEWKFARSKLYMEYIKDESTLPVPFNIIPAPKTVFYLLRSVFHCCGTEDETEIPHPGRVVDLEMFSAITGGQVRPANNASAQSSWDEQERHGQGIKHFQERMQTSNGFVRSDSDPNLFTEKLTYKRVMKRIVKRFIFDVQRENDANDDFDEIKQDISSFRYEMLNHVSLRQTENAENKERLDNLYSRVDSLLLQQKQLLHILGSDGNAAPRAAEHAQSLNSSRASSVSTILTDSDDSSVNSYENSLVRAKERACIKNLQEIPEEFEGSPRSASRDQTVLSRGSSARSNSHHEHTPVRRSSNSTSPERAPVRRSSAEHARVRGSSRSAPQEQTTSRRNSRPDSQTTPTRRTSRNEVLQRQLGLEGSQESDDDTGISERDVTVHVRGQKSPVEQFDVDINEAL